MISCKLFTGGNKSIHFLDLSWNHIRLSGAVGLCKGLQRNTSIINMNLAWNGLAFQGSLAIEEMLKQNTCLKFFDVSNNRINWEGVSYVAKGLKRNGTLQMLKVKNDISGLRGYILLKQHHSDHSEKWACFFWISIDLRVFYTCKKKDCGASVYEMNTIVRKLIHYSNKTYLMYISIDAELHRQHFECGCPCFCQFSATSPLTFVARLGF